MDLLYRTGMDSQFIANGAVQESVEHTKLNRSVTIGCPVPAIMNEAGLRELLMDHVRKVCNGTQFYGLPEQLARRQLKELTSIGNGNVMFEMQQTAVSLALPSTELNLLQPDSTCCVGSAVAAAPTAWEMPTGPVRFSGGGYMIFRAWASYFGSSGDNASDAGASGSGDNAATDGDRWMVSNQHAASLCAWTAFEGAGAEGDLDCQQFIDSLVSFTVEPVVAVSEVIKVLCVPLALQADVFRLVKSYVQQAAFSGSECSMTAPGAKLASAHDFLLKAGAIEKRPEAPTCAFMYQLTDDVDPVEMTILELFQHLCKNGWTHVVCQALPAASAALHTADSPKQFYTLSGSIKATDTASFYRELLRGGRQQRLADELVLLPPPGEERGRGSRGRGRGRNRKRKLGPVKPGGKVSSETALHDDDEGDRDEPLHGLVDEWKDVISVADSDSAASLESRPESQSDLQKELEELMQTELTERVQAATAFEDAAAAAQSVEEHAATTINGEDAAAAAPARAPPAREQAAAEVKDAPAPAPPTAGEQTAALGEDTAALPAGEQAALGEVPAAPAAPSPKIMHQSGAGKLGS
ncbi:unnamed protein product [Symbiodinium sp. CCMP2592]|nr:unnamed protein product [Symbiodinium sp. CCMP2592]